MDAVQFQQFVKSEVDAASVESVRSRFGVTRQAIYRWMEGKKPSQMTLELAALLAVQSKGEPNDIPLSTSTPLNSTPRSNPAPVIPHPKLKPVTEVLGKVRPKYGEKCPHGWANWMLCDKCKAAV